MKKIRQRSLLILLIGLSSVLALCLFTVVGKAEVADSLEVTVKLHRSEWSEESETLPHTRMPSNGMTKRKGKGINGITFSAYDVTEEYFKEIEAGSTPDQAKHLLSIKGSLLEGQPIQTAVTKNDGNEDGVATFQLPMYKNKGEAAYLFVETDEGQTEVAVNTVSVFPMKGELGEVLDLVHIYTKLKPSPTPDPENPELTFKKDIDRHVVSYGETINYKLVMHVPHDIGEYERFDVMDRAEPALLLTEKSIRFTVNGDEAQDITEDILERKHGFDIVFDPERLEKYADEELVIHYQMTLSSEGIPDKDIINEATLYANDDVLKDTKMVRTGGYHFIKLDMLDHTKGLAGAKFVVQNSRKDYLYADNNQNYEWRPTDKLSLTDKGLVLLTSDEQGEFEIKGLSYGEYFLTEVVAPKGYVLRDIQVPFEIDDFSYELSEKAGIKLEVFNEPETPTEPDKPLDPVDPTRPPGPTNPTEPPKGILPQTGEEASVLLGWMGMVLIYLVSKKYRTNKERKHEDETN